MTLSLTGVTNSIGAQGHLHLTFLHQPFARDFSRLGTRISRFLSTFYLGYTLRILLIQEPWTLGIQVPLNVEKSWAHVVMDCFIRAYEVMSRAILHPSTQHATVDDRMIVSSELWICYCINIYAPLPLPSRPFAPLHMNNVPLQPYLQCPLNIPSSNIGRFGMFLRIVPMSMRLRCPKFHTIVDMHC